MMANNNTNARGSSAQFFVAAELCRRDLVAVVTMGNTPNTDILCSNAKGSKFVHIQVKTYVPGNAKVPVGEKAETNNGRKFIWVLAGIPTANMVDEFEYYIIPSNVMSKNIQKDYQQYLDDSNKINERNPKGGVRNKNSFRTVHIPPEACYAGWRIDKYKNRWDIIEKLLK
jgi:hypothetical protein